MLVISLGILLGVYTAGVVRLWRAAGPGRGIRRVDAFAFLCGWLALVVALSPPLDEWSETWLAAHMVQHELLMVIAAPLIAISAPIVALLWAAPGGMRQRVIAAVRRPPVTRLWAGITAPLTVFVLHLAALWIWHLPSLYDAALEHEAVHIVQHLCFFFSAALFWWGIAHGRYGRLGYGAAVIYVFATAVHSGVLGALLTFSPRVWYAPYLVNHPPGLTPLEDQQLAGLLMWVPAGLIFVVGALALLAAWIRESDRHTRFNFNRGSAPDPRSVAHGDPGAPLRSVPPQRAKNARRGPRLAGAPCAPCAPRPSVKQSHLILPLLLAASLLSGCGRHTDAVGGGASAPRGRVPGAPPTTRFVSDVSSGEWRMPAGDYGNLRYSTLDAIKTTNVMNLQVVTTFSTGVPHGHEGQPLVFGNTMYVVTPFPNNLVAVDLTKPGGAVKWIYEPHPDRRAVGIACCDVVNRGASYADGKIIYSLLDTTVVAVDIEDGHEVWRTRVGDVNRGETFTAAPIVVKDKVIVGNSGGELGVRGYVAALDVRSGKELWRAFNTGPDSEVKIGAGFRPFYAKDQGKDLGVTSWPSEQWKLGGSTVWGWISYDPETNLFFYGTGNPGVWNPDLRPGDNKWSCSIIARDADTGEARWAYQVTGHDSWDYDEIMENVLVDMDYGGRTRKLIVHPGRTGYVYVLDRETGELLSAETYQPVNWSSGYNLETGKPNEDPTKQTHFGAVTHGICPSSTGAKDVIPSAFSPRTGLLYIPAHNTCMDYEGIEANYIAGTPYLGADVRMYMGPGGYQGELVAWDVAHNRKAWGVRDDKFPIYSGVLATGGDVVFYGTMDGWFKAVDARTGTELWKFHTASGIVGNPITYLGPDGKQYVAVYSGIGGWMGAVAFPEVSADDPYAGLGVVGAMKDIKKYTAAGSTVYVFGL